MICSHCGFSNDTSEHRCSRCGRPLQLRMGAYWRRSGLESDSLLASLPASGLSEPPPPRQPLWKQELNRKLEGYRDRQKQSESERLVAVPEALQGQRAENRSEPSPGRMAAAAGAGAVNKRLPAVVTQAVGPAGPKPKGEANWRRVSPPPDAPKLPPLPKPAEAMAAAGAKPVSHASRPATLASRPATHASMIEPPPAERSEARNGEPRGAAAAAAQRQGREVAATATIAPLAIRAVAGVLDFAVIVVALGVFLAVFYLMGGVALTDLEGLRAIAVAFLAIVCFYWIFYVGYLGGTSGMNWLGLRVLNFDGEPPSSAQRRTRAVGTILSTLSLGLGFAWSIADEEKLTWHDRMSKTFVTREGSMGFRTRATRPATPGKRLPELRSATRA
jgi:uncharacterized RDD family membrane protein YckC